MDNQNTKRNVIKEQWDVATMMPREFNKRSLTAKGLVAIWFAMAICVGNVCRFTIVFSILWMDRFNSSRCLHFARSSGFELGCV